VPALEIKDQFGQDHVLDSDYALFSVEDNGIGIEKDEADKIFDRFYRSKNGESIVGKRDRTLLCQVPGEKAQGTDKG
jgi:signal transduction histidine kinase